MYIKINQCPACGETEFTNHIIVKDHAVTQESFAIVICKNCNLKFTNPRPSKDNLSKYYDSPAYISHSSNASNPIDLAYKIARYFTLNNKINIVNSFISHGKILDIGSGTGSFLKVAENNRWEVTGVEPHEKARHIAEKKLSKTVLENIFEIQQPDGYDAITLWHVLEHVEELSETLQQIKKLLKKTGYLFVAVPNVKAYDAQIYKEDWAAYDVPRHLYHFEQKSLKYLMNEHKLKIKAILPLKLDAYYISLLSEKYKTGKSNYINALKNARLSNLWAAKNNGDYSSLIYVIKK